MSLWRGPCPLHGPRSAKGPMSKAGSEHVRGFVPSARPGFPALLSLAMTQSISRGGEKLLCRGDSWKCSSGVLQQGAKPSPLPWCVTSTEPGPALRGLGVLSRRNWCFLTKILWAQGPSAQPGHSSVSHGLHAAGQWLPAWTDCPKGDTTSAGGPQHKELCTER